MAADTPPDSDRGRPSPAQVDQQRRLATFATLAAAAVVVAGGIGWYRGVNPLGGGVVTTDKTMHRVIVTLKGVGAGKDAATAIAKLQDKVLSAIAKYKHSVERRYDVLPQMAVTVDDAGLEALKSHPDVQSVAKDTLVAPNPSTPK